MRGRVTIEMFDCVPEIDHDSGNRYFLGNTQNYAQALLSILKSIKAKLPILQTMVLTQEYEGLRSITQTLQKMFGNIGALGLAEASYQIEKSLLNDEIGTKPELLINYAYSLVTFAEHLELLFHTMDIKQQSNVEEDSSSNFMNYDFTKTKESIRLSADLLERKII